MKPNAEKFKFSSRSIFAAAGDTSPTMPRRPRRRAPRVHESRAIDFIDGGASEDEEGDGDEVFALKGLEKSDDDNDDDDDPGPVAYEDESDREPHSLHVEDEDHALKQSAPKAKNEKGRKKDPLLSSEDDDSESDEETWGVSKAAYYASTADQLDPDDEEANEMQEQEARRLQALSREEMNEADFGLEDAVDHSQKKGVIE